MSTLCDEKVDQGTYLETVVLLAKYRYDNILKCYLGNVTSQHACLPHAAANKRTRCRR